MPRGSGYSIRLTLTKEMRIALTKLTAQEEAPKDFPLILKALRLSLLCYGVLDGEDLQAMYRRKLIVDDEAQFLLENGFVKDDRARTLIREKKLERLKEKIRERGK